MKVPASATGQEKEIGAIRIEKGDGQPSLFADYMILHIENPKDSTIKLLELMRSSTCKAIENGQTI